jgi:hypothetical protein
MNVRKIIEEELSNILKEEDTVPDIVNNSTKLLALRKKAAINADSLTPVERKALAVAARIESDAGIAPNLQDPAFAGQTPEQQEIGRVINNPQALKALQAKASRGDSLTPLEQKILQKAFRFTGITMPEESPEAGGSAPAPTAARPRPRPEVKELQTLLNQVLSAKGLQTLKPQPGAKDGVDGRYGKDTRTKLLQIIPEKELKPLTIAQIIEKLKGMTGTETQPTAQTESKCPKELPVKILGTPSVFDIYGIKYTVINSAMPKNSSQKMCVNLTEVEQKDDPSDMDQEPGAVPPPPLQYKVIETMALQESKSLRGMILKEILAALK